MRRFQIFMAVMSLAVVASAGCALAFGPDAGNSGSKVARIAFIDRAQNLIQLSDGMELRASSPRMLDNLTVGQWVKVDYSSDGDRVTANNITPARPEVSAVAPGGPAHS
ncbi:MAG TPA: hypothetical protein VIF11_13270 [Methylomirabilota bacterium]|jgi:hypothetical protein